MMARMRLRRSIFFMAALSVAMIAGAAPVLAGFEWKPPAGTPADSSPSPAPVPVAAPQELPAQGSPINWDNAKNAPQMPAQGSPINWDNANTSQMPVQAVQGIEAIPLTSTEKKKRPPVASSPDVITGFGSDLPLIVALQQVVPQQYKVSLSPGVDAGVHVSWQGDKPWEQSLSDMLAPERLVYAIQGNTLVVKTSGGADTSASIAPAPSKKTDMIPQDMISSNANEEFMPVESAQPIKMSPQPMAMSAQPMTIRPVSNPAPIQEPVPAPGVLEPAWHAERGKTLRSVLEEWSKEANVQLYWSTDYDYRLNSDFSYGGNFDAAVGKLLDQFSNVKPQPYGQLHRNPENGSILVINTYGTYN